MGKSDASKLMFYRKTVEFQREIIGELYNLICTLTGKSPSAPPKIEIPEEYR